MAAAFDGVVYVAGGYYDATGEWKNDSFQNTLYALDTKEEAPKWRQLAAIPVPRGDAALIAIRDGRLMFIGGETHARGKRTKVRTLRLCCTAPAPLWRAPPRQRWDGERPCCRVPLMHSRSGEATSDRRSSSQTLLCMLRLLQPGQRPGLLPPAMAVACTALLLAPRVAARYYCTDTAVGAAAVHAACRGDSGEGYDVACAGRHA